MRQVPGNCPPPTAVYDLAVFWAVTTKYGQGTVLLSISEENNLTGVI